jgi:hypothetical protein
MMLFQQVKLTNYTAFGEKVKAWAKGTDQIPKDLDELKEQLAAAQVGATVPERITKVEFVQAGDDTWIIRLPAKTYLEAAEERLKEVDYTLPTFMSAFSSRSPRSTTR